MIDKKAIEEHIKGILIALGDNPDREGLKDTPNVWLKCMKKYFRECVIPMMKLQECLILPLSVTPI